MDCVEAIARLGDSDLRLGLEARTLIVTKAPEAEARGDLVRDAPGLLGRQAPRRRRRLLAQAKVGTKARGAVRRQLGPRPVGRLDIQAIEIAIEIVGGLVLVDHGRVRREIRHRRHGRLWQGGLC